MKLHDGEFTLDDWKILSKQFANGPIIENEQFFGVTCIMSQKSDVAKFNINRLWLLNCSVAMINAVHTGGTKISKANSDTVKDLEAQLLLVRSAISVGKWSWNDLITWWFYYEICHVIIYEMT